VFTHASAGADRSLAEQLRTKPNQPAGAPATSFPRFGAARNP